MDLNLGNGTSSSSNNWSSMAYDREAKGTDWQVTPHEHPPASKDPSKPYSPDGDDLIKVVLLGAPGVGKTAIVQQFVWNTFEPSYYPTSKKETYYPSVILHDKNYSLKIVDIPDIPFFPVNSFYNISDLQVYGLRDANAYILVYDLLSPESFEYISSLFNQISESRDLSHVPVVVVGNKTDKVMCSGRGSGVTSFSGSSSSKYDAFTYGSSSHSSHSHSSKYRSVSGRKKDYHDYDDDFGSPHDHHHDGFGSHGFGHHHHTGSSKYGSHSHRKDKHSRDRHGHHSRHSRHNGYGQHNNGRRKIWIPYEDDNYLEKETAEKVTGEWKAIYKECSAQDPESVTQIFKSLMEVVEEHGVDDGLDGGVPKKCVIL